MKFAVATMGIGAFLASPAAAGPITNTTYLPTPDEQFVVALVNQARQTASGLTVLSRIVTNDLNSITASSSAQSNNGTQWSENFWTSSDSDVASAMNFFHVSPGDLKKQFQDLTLPGTPLAWNGNLGNVANQYNALVIADKGKTDDEHSIAPYNPYPGNPSRYSDGGYAGNAFGENAFRNYNGSAFYSYAAFMVDWTSDNDGIQDAAGHRSSLTSSSFRDFGVSIQSGYDVGNHSSIQELGARDGVQSLTGIAYNDANHNNFFDPGEGIGNVTISAKPTAGGGAVTTTTWSAGGYTLALSPGSYSISASGAFGTVQLGTTVIGTQNVEVDVVNPVPEPSAMALGAVAVIGMLGRRRRTVG